MNNKQKCLKNLNNAISKIEELKTLMQNETDYKYRYLNLIDLDTILLYLSKLTEQI